jgi:hypothetical protein
VGRGRSKAKPIDIVSPPAEQMTASEFIISDVTDKRNGGGSITIGKAYRRKPMIDTLLAQNILTHDEHRALRHYRHHADIADRSPVRDSLCTQRNGGGNGPTVTLLNAIRVRADCERAAGSLSGILQAVVIYDLSLSQYAMIRAGAVEQRRKGKSTLEPRRGALEIAKLEIRMAARRVEAELAA